MRASTGCRYGEIVDFRAGDFDRDAGAVSAHASKADRSRHVVLTDDGVALFERHAPKARHCASVNPIGCSPQRAAEGTALILSAIIVVYIVLGVLYETMSTDRRYCRHCRPQGWVPLLALLLLG